MAEVTIYGKDDCPYTTGARDDYAGRGFSVNYINVKEEPQAMSRMLELSSGRREVPVIVEGEKVTVGFGGT
ncbi:MAG: glutaredoxin family protein [Candidatus Brocadiales bacterium]|nr:glutaredoxin family protein [Candidatus Bathyanammoxibius sp.]MCQ4574577.1 glutaredoxin family protein [Candidatus Bathyanammoxibius amoris]